MNKYFQFMPTLFVQIRKSLVWVKMCHPLNKIKAKYNLPRKIVKI